MAEGDVFEVGDAIRVKLSESPRECHREYLIERIDQAGSFNGKPWPWPDRVRLGVVWFKEDEQRWAETWFHSDDPDVRPCPDSKLLQLRAAQILLGGCDA